MIGIGTGMGAAPMRVPMPIIGAQLVLEHVANYAPYPPPTRVHAHDSISHADKKISFKTLRKNSLPSALTD